MKTRAAVLVWALATVAGAQTTIRPGGGGGSSTITAGTTATSGCTDGGFLYSLTSLIRCGAVLTTDGTNVITASLAGSSAANGDITINGTTSATKTTSYVNLQDTGGNVGIGTAAPDSPLHVSSAGAGVVRLARFQNPTVSGYSSIVLGNSSGTSYWEAWSADGPGTGGVGNPSNFGFSLFTNGRDNPRLNVASTGAITIGTSSLGTSVVPLTVTPGTGSTANMINATNSGGTPVWSIGKAGTPVYASGIPAVSNTSANSCGTTAATIAGTAETGIITVGATSGTSCTVTFAVAAPTRRQCVVTNETTGVAVKATYSSSTVSLFAGTFAASDVLAYICQVY